MKSIWYRNKILIAWRIRRYQHLLAIEAHGLRPELLLPGALCLLLFLSIPWFRRVCFDPILVDVGGFPLIPLYRLYRVVVVFATCLYWSCECWQNAPKFFLTGGIISVLILYLSLNYTDNIDLKDLVGSILGIKFDKSRQYARSPIHTLCALTLTKSPLSSTAKFVIIWLFLSTGPRGHYNY